jgi:hypothetical protein
MDTVTRLLREKWQAEERLKVLVTAIRTAVQEGRSYGGSDTQAGREEAAERVERALHYHLRTWEAEDKL